jgi:hypothetical protein
MPRRRTRAALDDGEPCEAALCHAIDHRAQGLVRIRHRGIPPNRPLQRTIEVSRPALVEDRLQVVPAHHADQAAGAVDDRVEQLPMLRTVPPEGRAMRPTIRAPATGTATSRRPS